MTLHAEQFADSTGLAFATSSQSGAVWRSRAACLGLNDLFFAGKGHHEESQVAYSVCDTCPVTAECLDYAVTNRITEGVWGGLNERERRRYVKNKDQRDIYRALGRPGKDGAVAERKLTCKRCAKRFVRERKRGPVPWYCSDLCRYEARLEKHRRYNAAKKGAPKAHPFGHVGDSRAHQHGTAYTYHHHGCRCAACKRASASAQKKRRLAEREAS